MSLGGASLWYERQISIKLLVLWEYYKKNVFFLNCICILMTIQDFKKKTIYAESKFHHGPQKIEELK